MLTRVEQSDEAATTVTPRAAAASVDGSSLGSRSPPPSPPKGTRGHRRTGRRRGRRRCSRRRGCGRRQARGRGRERRPRRRRRRFARRRGDRRHRGLLRRRRLGRRLGIERHGDRQGLEGAPRVAALIPRPNARPRVSSHQVWNIWHSPSPPSGQPKTLNSQVLDSSQKISCVKIIISRRALGVAPRAGELDTAKRTRP